MASLLAPKRDRLFVLWLACLLPLAACGGGAPPVQAPVPRPVSIEPAPGALQPTAADLRAAGRARLTGLELGTMWTFENPPLEYWRAAYGFNATPQWLEHVRLASVRYGEICSASFVSPTGLAMTNHHCARQCIEAVSSAAQDYLVTGFYAAVPGEELVCPGLYLDQLVAIENVTARVRGAAPAGAPDSVVAAAQAAEREAIEAACEAASQLTCQVVALYHGGQYQLYQYRRYAPVKLVFAPELQAGYFGGDPDNFTYPRYALDMSFVRAYADDGQTPAQTPQFFRWNPAGAAEGELVFVTGNPGSTSRLTTVAQVLYEQQFRHPFTVQLLEAQAAFLKLLAQQGPDMERRVRDDLFGIENALKAYTGQLAGLRDTLLIGQKIKWESDFRARVDADPELHARYGDVWDRIAVIEAEKLAVAPAMNVLDYNFFGFASPQLQLAGMLSLYVREIARPEAERLDGFQGQAAAQMIQMLTSPTPIDPGISTWLLENQLEFMRRWLPPGDPILAEAFLPGESPADAARRLISQTRTGDVAFRRAILDGGMSALQASTDPLLRLAASMEARHRELEARYEAASTAESLQEERLADALFAVFGTGVAPDATFTLRISDGVVARYPYNGTFAPPHTTYYGLYGRSADFSNEMPWTLPPSVAAARGAVELSTPINFVTTNDITGGNSGSPMIDREARVVGLAFDGNIEQLPNEFVFRTEAGRSVGVHASGILEALRNVYRAQALLQELLGAGAN